MIAQEIGDIANLHLNRLGTGDIACANFSDFGALLTWHKGFDAKFPTFRIWRSKISAKETQTIIHTRIKNDDQALKTVIEMKTISHDQDLFWREEGFRPQHEIAAQRMVSRIEEKLLPAAFQSGFKSMGWLNDYSKAYRPSSWVHGTHTALRWALIGYIAHLRRRRSSLGS